MLVKILAVGIKVEKANNDSAKSLGKTLAIFFAILGAIIIPVCIYISRSLIAKVKFLSSIYSLPAIFVGLIVATLFCIVVALVYTLGWRFRWFKSGYTTKPRLLLAILCATLIAYFSPVVSTPHQLFFDQHKNEFEHQVELIRQGSSIDHFGNLVVGTPRETHAIIFQYVTDHPVIFSSYAYVYAENHSDLDNYFMCNDISFKGGEGQIYATLSTNWYLCYRTDDAS
jgi:hypothetical protein